MEGGDSIDSRCCDESFTGNRLSEFLIDNIRTFKQLCNHTADIIDVIARVLICEDSFLLQLLPLVASVFINFLQGFQILIILLCLF